MLFRVRMPPVMASSPQTPRRPLDSRIALTRSKARQVYDKFGSKANDAEVSKRCLLFPESLHLAEHASMYEGVWVWLGRILLRSSMKVWM